MLNWEQILQKYILKYSNQISKATKPLQDHFGIEYFTYHRIAHDGRYTVLVDRPEWAEHYVGEQIYLVDPYLRDPSNYESGITFIENHGSEEYRDTVLRAGKKVLNLDMTALFIQKKENCVEFYGFSGNKAKSSLQNLYINHPKLLKSFASHFKNELGWILSQMDEEPGYLPDLKGQDYYHKEAIYPSIDSSARLKYYRDLGILDTSVRAERLSAREKECLTLLLEEKSAKETALILGLSVRTIEHYFENIKNKLHCFSKHELLSLAKILDDVGLLTK